MAMEEQAVARPTLEMVETAATPRMVFLTLLAMMIIEEIFRGRDRKLELEFQA